MHWASPLGKTVLQQISELYRALVWEGFILLAVAADEDNSIQPSNVSIKKQAKTLESKSGAGCSVAECTGQLEVEIVHTPPTPRASTASTVYFPQSVAPPPSSLDPAPMETTSAPARGSGTDPLGKSQTTSNSSGGSQPQHSSVLVESLKQLTPLLTVTSRVGRSLAELMSLLVRLSTSPQHRTFRRGAGHSLTIHGYLETSKEAMDVCMEITNLLADSLCWEVPMPHSCSSAMQSPIRDWLFAG